MSQTDASILLSTFTVFLLPFAHSWMKAQVLPDWLRFIIACIISAIGGYLSAIVGGKLVTTMSLIETAAVISTFGAGIYITAFGRLGLEKAIMPRAAVISEAQKSVAGQIGLMSTQTIKDAADPNSDVAIQVSAEPVSYLGSDSGPVQPQG